MSGGKLVYQSGSGGGVRRDAAGSAGPEVTPRAAAVHDLRVRRETGGRGGKQVTVAAPFFLAKEELSALLVALKRAAGTGGTIRTVETPTGAGYALELQGDRVELVLRTLAERGLRAKRAGG